MRQTAVSLSLCLIVFLPMAATVAAESPERGARWADSQRELAEALVGFPTAVGPADYYDGGEPDPLKVTLGRFLFFDKILSGNLNISCATCHHGLTDTGDGLSLPVGEGGIGLGVTRTVGHGPDRIEERVPRNAPPIFNLGAREFERMFADGRVELVASHPQVFRSPAGDDLPGGLDNVLAVQAMFPVTSATEMAGQEGENPQADHAASGNLPALWDFIAGKLRAVPEYVDLFVEVYGDDPAMPVASAADITYVHAANAIAAFEASAWRADNSAFDRHLRGESGVMSVRQYRGMRLFFGKAGCSDCHSGAFQTDHGFHSIGMPQIGPGKGDGFDGRDDFGRERITGDPADRFTFRTPSLRNVELTGPWGHDGAFDTLRGVVEHHLDTRLSSANYDPAQAVLPPDDELAAVDFIVHSDPARRAEIEASSELEPVQLRDFDVECLLDFLAALTDRSSLDLRRDVPFEVPSGLPVFD